MDVADSSPTAAAPADRSSETADNHAIESTNCNTEERADVLPQQAKRIESRGSEHSCGAMQNVTSFDYFWTIEGFSLLPKLGRHFSETFDAKGLKWGLFLEPWYYRGGRRYPRLTLYLEDEHPNTRKLYLYDLKVSYIITVFNQGSGQDKQYRDTDYDICARRLDCKWKSIELPSFDIFLEPSFGFLVDNTCAIGVQILDVSPAWNQQMPAGDTGRFRWTIHGFSAEQGMNPCVYKKFSACHYDWIICVLAGNRSHHLGSGGLHIYVGLCLSHTFCQLLGRFRIRLINQLTGKHIDKSFCSIFHAGRLHGCAGVVPLRTFLDEQEGFLIKDCCIVEVEVTVLSQRPLQQVWNYYRRACGDADPMATHHYASEEENAYHNPFAWDMSPY